MIEVILARALESPSELTSVSKTFNDLNLSEASRKSKLTNIIFTEIRP